jgi:hypothetical protein
MSVGTVALDVSYTQRISRSSSSQWFIPQDAPLEEPVCCVARDALGEYVLPFRCQRTKDGWKNHRTKTALQLQIVGWKY